MEPRKIQCSQRISIDRGFAAQHGVLAAIIFSELTRLSRKGTKWVRVNYEQLHARIPYAGIDTLRKEVHKLLSLGVVERQHLHTNKLDQSYSYRVMA